MKLNIYKIKCLMAELQMNQKNLGIKCDMNPNSLGVAFKKGVTSVVTAGKIAKALGTTVEEITVKE